MTTPRAQPATGRDRRRRVVAACLLVLLGADIGAVLALGLARLPVDLAAPGGLALWGGRVTGLLAQVLVLGVVLLASRVPLLERAAGQDRLLRWHRVLAPTALVALVAHPLLLAVAYAPGATSRLGMLVSLGSTTLDAVVGTGLFLLASLASVRALRRRLPYEGWHLLHATTYAAVVLSFLHQLTAGSAVLVGGPMRWWWVIQLVAVLALAVTYRVVLPLATLRHQGWTVTRTSRDASDVVTVTVTGRDVAGVRGGQFFVWRFLDRDNWWRAHPFSVSAVDDRSVHLTAREIGDGSRALSALRPGTPVLLEGPYGVMHAGSRRTDRVLLIGAGLGVAPIHALLQDLPAHVAVTVVQRASTREQAVLHDALHALVADRTDRALHLVTGPRGPAGDPHRPLGPAHLRQLVPDVASRDVYVCGPPALTADLLRTLAVLGVPRPRLHTESFEL